MEGQSQSNELLKRIFEGMHVYDNDGEKVGQVDFVYLGELHVETGVDIEPPTTSPPVTPGEGSWLDLLEDAFGADERIPEVVANRLLRSGFVRVDAPLFGRRRYITPDQIGSVSDDEVHLLVDGDRLYEEGSEES